MLNEQQKRAYATLLERARQAAEEAGEDLQAALHRVLDTASEKEEAFIELTREELEKVKQALRDDIDAIARYFEEVGEGFEEMLTMDAVWLEEKFLEASEKLADPTALQLARIRLMAALQQK